MKGAIRGIVNGPLDFALVASGPVGQAVEFKMCELCSRRFIRTVPSSAKLGKKICRGCETKEAAPPEPIPGARSRLRDTSSVTIQ